MKSLLQAAESYRAELIPQTPPPVSPSGDNIISSEETQEIMKEIDRLSGQSRINVTPDLFKITALKNGVLFPLLVNIAAAVILGGGIFATKYYFDVKDREMIQASAQQQSAEGNLIKEIKKETEQRLAEKENEIRNIQASMEQIESERQALELDMNSKISEREAQLQAEMEAALQAERTRLQSQGMSVQQIDEQIATLKLEQTAVFEQELASYRQEAELEKIELEESLNQLQSEYNTKLSAVNDERVKIEEEARSREAELTARMEARTRELESEMTQAQQELQKLTDAKEQENLVENQIIGFYKTIEDLIQAGDMDKASAELTNLENYLYDESVVGLEGIKKRREVDLFVIDSLSRLIEASADPREELDTMSLIDAAERLREIRQIVENADQQLAVGNREMADLMYRSALEKIPEINRSHRFFMNAVESELELGYEQLADIQSRYDQLQRENSERRTAVDNLLTTADRSYNAGDFARAVDAYRSAFEATGFEELDGAAERMLASGNNRAVAPFKETIDSISSELETLKNDKSLLEGSLSEKETELLSVKEELAVREEEVKAFNDQLEGRSGDLASLNEQLDSSLTEIEDLNEKLSASRGEMDGITDRLESEQQQVISLKEQLEQQTEDISTYEQRLEEMRQQLENERSRVSSSREESRLIDRDIAELTTLKARLNRLNKSYTDFELLAENLDDNLQGDAATIEALYDFFEEDSVEDLMPGIGEYLRAFSSVYITAGQEIGLYEAVSLLYDLNNIRGDAARVEFLNAKKREYNGNEAMIEIISQLQKSIRGGGNG